MLYTSDDKSDARDPIRRLAAVLYGCPCEIEFINGKIHINPEDPEMPMETVSLAEFLTRVAEGYEWATRPLDFGGSNPPKPT